MHTILAEKSSLVKSNLLVLLPKLLPSKQVPIYYPIVPTSYETHFSPYTQPKSSHKRPTNSVDRQKQTHAATHNICGLCVPGRRCPVVPLSLSLKRESELQTVSCVLTRHSAPKPGARVGGLTRPAGASRVAPPAGARPRLLPDPALSLHRGGPHGRLPLRDYSGNKRERERDIRIQRWMDG